MGKSEKGAHTDYESPWVTKVSALGAGVEAVMATQWDAGDQVRSGGIWGSQNRAVEPGQAGTGPNLWDR